MSESAQAFDVGRPISIKLQSPDGVKVLTVRFPSDEEWMERQRRRKIIIKSIGRNMTETVVQDAEDVDAEILARMRNGDGGPEVDQYEAARIMNQLHESEVEDVVMEDGAYRVSLRVPGASTSHLLRMPSAKEILKFRRTFSRIVDLRFNKQQVVMDLAVGGSLYDELLKESGGYAGAVPIIHKAMVVQAVINELETGLGVADEGNF